MGNRSTSFIDRRKALLKNIAWNRVAWVICGFAVLAMRFPGAAEAILAVVIVTAVSLLLLSPYIALGALLRGSFEESLERHRAAPQQVHHTHYFVQEHSRPAPPRNVRNEVGELGP